MLRSPSQLTLTPPRLLLPLEVAFEKNLKHAWEWVWFHGDREKESLRDTGFSPLSSRSEPGCPASHLPELVGVESQRRGEQRKTEGPCRNPGVPPRTGLDFRAQAKGCSLLESSAEQMFPYLPCY